MSTSNKLSDINVKTQETPSADKPKVNTDENSKNACPPDSKDNVVSSTPAVREKIEQANIIMVVSELMKKGITEKDAKEIADQQKGDMKKALEYIGEIDLDYKKCVKTIKHYSELCTILLKVFKEIKEKNGESITIDNNQTDSKNSVTASASAAAQVPKKKAELAIQVLTKDGTFQKIPIPEAIMALSITSDNDILFQIIIGDINPATYVLPGSVEHISEEKWTEIIKYIIENSDKKLNYKKLFLKLTNCNSLVYFKPFCADQNDLDKIKKSNPKIYVFYELTMELEYCFHRELLVENYGDKRGSEIFDLSGRDFSAAVEILMAKFENSVNKGSDSKDEPKKPNPPLNKEGSAGGSPSHPQPKPPGSTATETIIIASGTAPVVARNLK